MANSVSVAIATTAIGTIARTSFRRSERSGGMVPEGVGSMTARLSRLAYPARRPPFGLTPARRSDDVGQRPEVQQRDEDLVGAAGAGLEVQRGEGADAVRVELGPGVLL